MKSEENKTEGGELQLRERRVSVQTAIYVHLGEYLK